MIDFLINVFIWVVVAPVMVICALFFIMGLSGYGQSPPPKKDAKGKGRKQ